MADLSQIDLDSGEPSGGELGTEQNEAEDVLGLGGDSVGEPEPDDGRSKTEDLHLYFKQSWKARLGTTGIVIICFFALSLVMSFATLLFSYTDAGRSFLRGLTIILF